LELPFKSRRNIVISMVAGTAAVWFWNKSEQAAGVQHMTVCWLEWLQQAHMWKQLHSSGLAAADALREPPAAARPT
jgi:hypothetical protein